MNLKPFEMYDTKDKVFIDVDSVICAHEMQGKAGRKIPQNGITLHLSSGKEIDVYSSIPLEATVNSFKR